VVISNRQDWWNCSLTPSRFKAGIMWSGRSSVSILKNIQRILIFVENKYFQSCHTSRHNTRAGFDSAPLVSVEKGSMSEYYLERHLPIPVTAIQSIRDFF
jgi:hypothetical protein